MYMKFIAKFLTHIANIAVNTGTQACLYFVVDEPKMPNSLLNK